MLGVVTPVNGDGWNSAAVLAPTPTERARAAERTGSKLLSPRLRGEKLVGRLLWAPPDPDDGVDEWEKVRVLQYHTDADRSEFPYDVSYVWSTAPAHTVEGFHDEWSGADFEGCLLVDSSSIAVTSEVVAVQNADHRSAAAVAHSNSHSNSRRLYHERGEALVGVELWAPPA